MTTGNTPPARLVLDMLAVCLPIAVCAFAPYVILALSRFFLSDTPRALAEPLSAVDMYSLREPKRKGESPILHPTPLGGALSLATVGAVVALMASTLVQYRSSNVLLAQSALPVTLTALASLGDLPPARLAPSASAGHTDAVLRNFSSPAAPGTGFAVSISTMGGNCGALHSNASRLTSGAFVYTQTFDAATGAARHTFLCPACIPDALSMLTLAFDASCQVFAVTVVAAGAGGGLSSTAAYVANSAPPGAPAMGAVAAAFPLVLEAVQDGVGGAVPRESDGLVLGGRSVRGLVALPATGVESTTEVAVAGSVVLTILLPLQPTYTLYALSPIMSNISLLSALIAFVGFLGMGRLVQIAHEAEEWVDMGCCRRLMCARGKGVEPAAAGVKGVSVEPEGAGGCRGDGAW